MNVIDVFPREKVSTPKQMDQRPKKGEEEETGVSAVRSENGSQRALCSSKSQTRAADEKDEPAVASA